HQPSGRGQGAIPDLILQADELVRVRSDIEGILAEATGHDVPTLRADTDRDQVFTATSAPSYGLIDAVVTNRDLAPTGESARSCGEGEFLGVRACRTC